MKGFAPLFLGLIGTFVFSWAGLAWVPSLQIGHLDPQSDDEGADIYPWPQSGMAERGRQVYAANGCVYCHTQQVRADYAASDIDRKWGNRRSAPRDYLFARPVMLGKMRMGPDLANVGHRPSVEGGSAGSPAAGAAPGGSPAAGSSPPPPSAAAANAAAPAGSSSAPPPAAVAASASPAAAGSPPPGGAGASSPAPANPSAAGAASPASTTPAPGAATSAEATTGPNGEPLPYTAGWHHKHLYSPRSISLDSIMPAYRFLYQKRRVEGEYAADALKLTGDDAPPPGYEIVPSYDAKCLVAYLMSLDQSHPLKEVKSAAAPAAKGGK